MLLYSSLHCQLLKIKMLLEFWLGKWKKIVIFLMHQKIFWICVEWLVKTLKSVSLPCSNYYCQCLGGISGNHIKGSKEKVEEETACENILSLIHIWTFPVNNVPSQQALKSALELCIKRSSQCVFSWQAHFKLMRNNRVLAKVISKVFTLTAN